MAQCHNASRIFNCSIPKPHQHHHILSAISPSGGVRKARIQSHKGHKVLPFDRIANRLCLGAESYHCPLVTSVRLLHRLTPNHDPLRTVNQALGVGCKCNLPAKAGTGTLSDDADPKPCCIVLDIEGTTTPISFVTDVLFPYARGNVGEHLYETYETQETREDIKILRSQVESDLEQGVTGAIPIPSEDSGKDKVVSALVTNVEAMIKADRKITALKQLQGHIWRTGFLNNELEGVVYEDVPEALERWHKSGVKVYIYSSGSRLAQRLIFGKTAYGDLRKYLSGFFDTSIGNKRETRSYNEIYESVGVDKPSDILFITDVYQEAVAAKAAGLKVIISIRPGNGPLPQNHGFRTISSFLDI